MEALSPTYPLVPRIVKLGDSNVKSNAKHERAGEDRSDKYAWRRD